MFCSGFLCSRKVDNVIGCNSLQGQLHGLVNDLPTHPAERIPALDGVLHLLLSSDCGRKDLLPLIQLLSYPHQGNIG